MPYHMEMPMYAKAEEHQVAKYISDVLERRIGNVGFRGSGFSALFDDDVLEGAIPVMVVRQALPEAPEGFWVDFEFHWSPTLPENKAHELRFIVGHDTPVRGGLAGLACVALDAISCIRAGQGDAWMREIRSAAEMHCEVERLRRLRRRLGAGFRSQVSDFEEGEFELEEGFDCDEDDAEGSADGSCANTGD